jgi:hypothetical protein
MSRGFTQRRADRISRIRERVTFLDGRIAAIDGPNRDRDIAERSALLWVLEELDKLDMVEMAVRDNDGLPTPLQKLIAISSIVNARHDPTDEDIARTKALARLYGWTSEPSR